MWRSIEVKIETTKQEDGSGVFTKTFQFQAYLTATDLRPSSDAER